MSTQPLEVELSDVQSCGGVKMEGGWCGWRRGSEVTRRSAIEVHVNTKQATTLKLAS